MKDIKAILAGFNLTDEERETIIREVGENYRSVVEMTKKAQRIEELEGQNKALTEQVSNLEGEGEELEKLREQVNQFAEAEERRRANEEEASKRETFKARFNAAVGDREFTNDLIRDSIFEKTYAKCSGTIGYDPKEAIEELTKNTDGIWKNPQQDPNKMPSQNDLANNQDHEAKNDRAAIKSFMFGK